MHSRSHRRALGAVLAAVLAAGPQSVGAHVPGQELEPARRVAVNVEAPRFTLTDQDGNSFDSATRLRGKVVAVNFIYTTCSDVCPLFTVEFARLQQALKKEPGNNFFLLSITTDPEIDTPKILKAYARRFHADFDNWAFLTGSQTEVEKVWQAFGVRVIRKDRGLVQHTNLTTLIDARGARRINYFGVKWQAGDLLKDLRVLNKAHTGTAQ